MPRFSAALTASLAAALAACSPAVHPENIEPADTGGAYQAQYRDPVRSTKEPAFLISERLNAEKCLPALGGETYNTGKGMGLDVIALKGERLSRGDLVDIRILEDEVFTGEYEISRDGTLKLPYLDAIRAQPRAYVHKP